MDVLARAAGPSVANTSQHLRQPLRTGVVTSRRAGKRMFYELASPGCGR
ncbi:helix-turn-helix domain-containing protein [Streptomyces sirii]